MPLKPPIDPLEEELSGGGIYRGGRDVQTSGDQLDVPDPYSGYQGNADDMTKVVDSLPGFSPTSGGISQRVDSQQTYNPNDYEAARDDWMGNNEYAYGNIDEAKASARRWADKWGINYDDADVANLGAGGYIDLYEGFKTGTPKRRTWTAAGGNGDNPNGAGSGGGSGAGGGAGAGGGTGAGGGIGYGDPRISEAILRLLEEGFKPVDTSSKSFQDRYSPISNVMQRRALGDRDRAAERAAFEGSSIGGAGGQLDAEGAKIQESLALGEGQLMSQLISDDLQMQQRKIESALQFAQGEERMQLEAMLAELQREIQRYGIDTQRYGIDTSNRQFYDDLGYRIGRDEYLFNSDYWS